ncbi:hypothetical protein SAMN02745866_02700 [Alteromonadaceae bacterium Bs31]|nr:hypothetical protein SAMN02745866_02700 [Alteromonadaceae bacterium Bs31]
MNKDLILNEFRRVSEAMGWDSYHSPKNLASAISVESAKLLENFQWMSDLEAEMIDDPKRMETIAADLADLMIYCTVLCHKLDLDPWVITKDKLLRNRATYIEKLLAKEMGLSAGSSPSTPRAEKQKAWQKPPAATIPQQVNTAKKTTDASTTAQTDWDSVIQKIVDSREVVRDSSDKLRQEINLKKHKR